MQMNTYICILEEIPVTVHKNTLINILLRVHNSTLIRTRKQRHGQGTCTAPLPPVG